MEGEDGGGDDANGNAKDRFDAKGNAGGMGESISGGDAMGGCESIPKGENGGNANSRGGDDAEGDQDHWLGGDDEGDANNWGWDNAGDMDGVEGNAKVVGKSIAGRQRLCGRSLW